MLFFIFIFGLIVGSFLNCVIWRMHTRQSLFGRSMCVHCKNKISWYDNIPVFSFVLLCRRCRRCHKKISWQYPLVEFSTAVLFVLAYLQLPSYQLPVTSYQNLLTTYNLQLVTILRNLVFISFLIIIFVFDFRYYHILDIITVPAAIVACIFNLVLGMGWKTLVLGAIIGGGFFLFQFVVSMGKWIGGGDIRLGVVMGLMLGWQYTLLALCLAYLIGAVISLFLVIFKYRKFSSKIPFGTFLSTSTVITLLYGDTIMRWYWSLTKW